MRPVTAIPGESFNGLLHRWAAGNFIDRMFDITRAAGVEYPNFQDAALNELRDLSKIAEFTGLPLCELENRTLLNAENEFDREFYGVPIRKSDLEIFERRFAPASLQTSPHHRQHWIVRTMPFCSETWQYLRSTCHRENCGVVQRWSSTFGIERCDRCLADLRDGTCDYVPDEQREALSQVVCLLSPNHVERQAALSSLPAQLSGVTAGTAYELLIRLMKVVDPTLPLGRPNMHLGKPEELSSAMAQSWDILRTWPKGFHDMAAEKVRPRVGRDDGNDGETMRFLRLWRCRSRLHDPVARDIVHTLSNSIDIAQGTNSTKFVNINEAAGAVGLKQSRLSNFRRRGILRTHFAIRHDRPIAAFCGVEIAGLNAGFEDRISIETARCQLGISSHGVEQLLALDLVDEIAHPYFRARYASGPVSRTSLVTFITRFDSNNEPINEPTISLNDASKVIGGRLKPWGSILKMLLDRDIDFNLANCSAQLVKNIHIRLSDVPGLRRIQFGPGQARPFGYESLMSKRDTGETLNLGPVQTTELLSSHFTPRGSRSPAVPVSVVENLALKYISTAELALRLGVSKQRAYYTAKAAGVTQIYPGGFCRSEADEHLELGR